jgi:hypothetical protein
MLRAIEGGKVAGCQWRQADIVHIETTIDLVTASGNKFVFFDRNATLPYSQPYTDLAQLEVVAWDLLTESPQLDGFCKYWLDRPSVDKYADRMERRQAEFLVKDSVPLGSFVRFGAINEQRVQEVRAILAQARVDLPVEVKHDWYFLGQ